MATGAVLGEKLGALGQRVVSEKRDGAFPGDAFRAGQRLDAFGASPCFFDGGFVGGVATVLGQGQESEEEDAAEQRTGEADVEAMAELPPADDRHEENDEHGESGNNDRAPDFRAAREKFQELEEKEKIPFRPRG